MSFATDEVHLTRAVPVRLTLTGPSGHSHPSLPPGAPVDIEISRQRTTRAAQPGQRAGEDMAEHRRRRPLIPVIILLAAVLAAGGYFWWRSVRSTEPTELSASGAVEARQYQVASVIAGRVTKVAVSEGDVVKQGQTLVVLDQAALKLQVDQAEQGVKAARAALSNAKEDGTDADVSAARARLNQAEAAVDLAKVQLGYATVTAPHSGVVVTLTTNAGENAGPGRTLLTLSDPEDLRTRIRSRDPDRQRQGRPAGHGNDGLCHRALHRHRQLCRLGGGVHAHQRGDQGSANQARVRGTGAHQ